MKDSKNQEASIIIASLFLILISNISYLKYVKAQSIAIFPLQDVNTFSCGDALTINHNIGTLVPEIKTVNYGTVKLKLLGVSKCWITQNLGATNQASSATDNTEASAGWYWQFNRKQGYKHDGTTLTPAWTITNINENSDWLAIEDPCTIELGNDWRIPTYTEWLNADAKGKWDNVTDAYNTVLKLHAAGSLNTENGSLSTRGSFGMYWSSKQHSETAGWNTDIDFYVSGMFHSYKAYGLPVRCIKD